MWSFYNLFTEDECWNLGRRCFSILKQAIRCQPGKNGPVGGEDQGVARET